MARWEPPKCGWIRPAERDVTGESLSITQPKALMSKRDDQLIAKLVKKAASKVAPPKDRSAQYDSTLRVQPREEDAATKRLFKDMKRREF